MSLDNIQNMIIGTILLVVIIGGGLLFLGSFVTEDSTLDSTNEIGGFNRTMNKAAEVTTSATSIKTSVDSLNSSSNILDMFNVLLGGAYNGVKATLGTLGFISTGLTETTNYFGFTAATGIIALIGLIVFVIIGFAIWSAIMRL